MDSVAKGLEQAGVEYRAARVAADQAHVEAKIAADPWAHRSDNMKCKTCMWFAPKLSDKPGTTIGRCRRHAPTMNGYPVVFVSDWCGDHKLDETKI